MDYRMTRAMTRAEFADFMYRFEKTFREAEQTYDKISDIITPEFFYSHNYMMLMIEALAANVGDTDNTIDWWVFEADFGRKKEFRKVSWTDANGDEHEMTINNAADLYDYIMVD